jgi:zinc/manganese transport system permease protein
MSNAFLAGSAIAVAAGLAGYFLALRNQLFTGDALSHVAFTGALAALAAGLDGRVGLFGATVALSVIMGVVGRRGRPDDVVIGILFAWVLGLGVLFLTVYTRAQSTANGAAGVRVLFGSIFGLGVPQARLAAVVGAAVALALVAIARPLLFASVDEAVAEVKGVPVQALGVGFLVLVGVCAAEAAQAVGALLLLGLLATPAGAALRLTGRPYLALALSAALSLGAMWFGLTASYLVPRMPPSFAVVAMATVFYLASLAWRSRP